MGCCSDECLGEKSVTTNTNNNPPVISTAPVTRQNSNEGPNKVLTLNKIRHSRTNAEEFNLDNYKDLMLKLHNEFRDNYNLPLLSKNEELNDMASKYAESLVENKGKFINTSNIYNGQLVGENIIISESKKAEDVFNMITKEKNSYDYKKNKFSKLAGHFTQMIWKETTDIGIGFMEDKENKKYYSVILYYPTGNCLGQFKKNVNEEKK